MLYYSGTYIAVWLYVCERTLVIKGNIFLCEKLSQADFNLQRASINKFLFIRFILISKIKWIYKYFNCNICSYFYPNQNLLARYSMCAVSCTNEF